MICDRKRGRNEEEYEMRIENREEEKLEDEPLVIVR